MCTSHKPNDLVTIDRIAAGHAGTGDSWGIIQINPCPLVECSVCVAADRDPGSLGGIGGSGLNGVSTQAIDPGLVLLILSKWVIKLMPAGPFG